MTFPLFWSVEVWLQREGRLAGEEGVSDDVRAAVEASFRTERANGIRFSRSRVRLPWGEPSFPVSEEELAGILPSPECAAAGTNDFPSSTPILPLGRSPGGRLVGPPVEVDQGRHLAILGETGMGKSSSLVSVARKAASLGGVILLDPLGETAGQFLESLPAADRERLVTIAPGLPGCTLNALEGITGPAIDPVLADRRLNDIVHAFRRVRSGRYVESSYWGPRLEEMLTRAIAAAAGFGGGTLEDAHTFLATGGRTRQVVPPEAAEAVRTLADRVRERPEDAEGARRLLYEVVRSPVLARMLCDRNPPLHSRQLVEDGRIVVISGEAPTVGESVARYLLAVYLALVWSELLARPTHAKTFVLLDECQWFSHESLAEMLRLARRRNVHVVLATQTVSSLSEPVAEAVWTNVSDFLAFRGSPEEARELSRISRGLAVEELLALPRGHAAALLGKGNRLEWVRTTGRPAQARFEVGSVRGPDSDTTNALSSETVRGEPERTVVSEENVLRWIADRARHVPDPARFRVELGELRRDVDPSGRAVRIVGTRLQRSGSLISTERRNGSTVWVLDATRLPHTGPCEGSPSSTESAFSSEPLPETDPSSGPVLPGQSRVGPQDRHPPDRVLDGHENDQIEPGR